MPTHLHHTFNFSHRQFRPIDYGEILTSPTINQLLRFVFERFIQFVVQLTRKRKFKSAVTDISILQKVMLVLKLMKLLEIPLQTIPVLRICRLSFQPLNYCTNSKRLPKCFSTK